METKLLLSFKLLEKKMNVCYKEGTFVGTNRYKSNENILKEWYAYNWEEDMCPKL